MNIETKDNQYPDELPRNEKMMEVSNKSRSRVERIGGEDQERTGGRNEKVQTCEWRDDGASHKLKVALQKMKKSKGETMKKKDVMDEDDLIERELEDGVELAMEDEKIKRERR
ncbi:hypothetical protein REPUB_Repub04eG0158700 [Reevesia pubescens]